MDRTWLAGPRSPDDPDREIPRTTRTRVFNRDASVCRYCGRPGTSLDHVFPWTQGGSHDETNLVVACIVCNSIAGLRDFPEFILKRAYVLFRRAQIGSDRIIELEAMVAAGRPVDIDSEGIR